MARGSECDFGEIPSSEGGSHRPSRHGDACGPIVESGVPRAVDDAGSAAAGVKCDAQPGRLPVGDDCGSGTSAARPALSRSRAMSGAVNVPMAAPDRPFVPMAEPGLRRLS